MAGPALRSRNWFGKKDLDGFAHRSCLRQGMDFDFLRGRSPVRSEDTAGPSHS